MNREEMQMPYRLPKRWRSGLAWFLALITLPALVAVEETGAAPPQPPMPTAVLSGGYFCSAGVPGQLSHSISFRAAGIAGEAPAVNIDPLGPGDMSVCQSLATAVADLAASLGCATKTILRPTNIDVRLVCEGEASTQLHVMGDLARFVISR